jgi:hypothetical protein
MAEAVYVPVSRLTGFVIDALLKMGVPQADAEVVTERSIPGHDLGFWFRIRGSKLNESR